MTENLTEKWEVQLRKGTLELAILAALQQRTLYGLELLKLLQSLPSTSISEGTLYPLLDRLKRDALVDASWVTEGDSRPRKYYQLTEQGQSKLLQMRALWRQSVTDIEQLLTSPGPQVLTMSQVSSQVLSSLSAPSAASAALSSSQLNPAQPNPSNSSLSHSNHVDPQPQHSDGDAQ